MPRAAASVRPASPLTPLQRLALGRAWAGGHDALALPRGEQGPGVSTWRALQARGLVDPGVAVPGPVAPGLTAAGERALGLPLRGRGDRALLRAAMGAFVLWPATPAFGREMEALSLDGDDGEPRHLTGHPDAWATVDGEAEDDWEAAHGPFADECWDRVIAAVEGRGLVLDTQRHPVARVIYRERGAAALSGARGG